MAVDCGQLSSYPGSPGYYHPDKNAAVLTLMFVARCIETLECSEEDLGTCDEGPTAARLISAANEAIEAAAALGLTRKYRYVNEISEDFALDAAENNKISDSEISETLIKAALSKIGRAGAAEKLSNDKRQHAKNQVSLKWKEWQANPKLYDNDSAFALVMVNEWTGVLRSQPVITGWCRAWRKIL